MKGGEMTDFGSIVKAEPKDSLADWLWGMREGELKINLNFLAWLTKSEIAITWSEKDYRQKTFGIVV